MDTFALRQMTMADADKMLEWKNYPETRKFALVSRLPISSDSHYRWLKNNLSAFRIIVYNNHVCGAIRVQNQEVSIWIDRKWRRQGLAAGAIRKVSRRGFTAKIATGNVASMLCFVKCGYWPVVSRRDYCLLRK